jgi:hypothetical protein
MFHIYDSCCRQCAPCNWAGRNLYVGEACFPIFMLGAIKILTATSSGTLVFVRKTIGVTSGEIVIVILK